MYRNKIDFVYWSCILQPYKTHLLVAIAFLLDSLVFAVYNDMKPWNHGSVTWHELYLKIFWGKIVLRILIVYLYQLRCQRMKYKICMEFKAKIFQNALNGGKIKNHSHC